MAILDSLDPTLLAEGGILALIGAFIGFFILVGVAVYVYTSLTMYLTAKRLQTEPAWLAWIPFANLYLVAKMADKPWWPMLLLLVAWIPFIGWMAGIAFTVFSIIWLWKICEKRGFEGWFAILTLVPFFGGIWQLILWGLLAWDNSKGKK